MLTHRYVMFYIELVRNNVLTFMTSFLHNIMIARHNGALMCTCDSVNKWIFYARNRERVRPLIIGSTRAGCNFVANRLNALANILRGKLINFITINVVRVIWKQNYHKYIFDVKKKNVIKIEKYDLKIIYRMIYEHFNFVFCSCLNFPILNN